MYSVRIPMAVHCEKYDTVFQWRPSIIEPSILIDFFDVLFIISKKIWPA